MKSFSITPADRVQQRPYQSLRVNPSACMTMCPSGMTAVPVKPNPTGKRPWNMPNRLMTDHPMPAVIGTEVIHGLWFLR